MAQGDDKFIFQLFVSATNPSSRTAEANLERLCVALGEGDCQVEIIDVGVDPARAESSRVFAVPTLVKASPLPALRVLGDLSDPEKILPLLGVLPRRQCATPS